MYRKIIVGYDLEDGGRDALALARVVAEATGSDLVVAKVFPLELVPHGAGADWREREADALAQLVRVADLEGATADVVPSSSRGRGLYELAEEVGADLIVIGSSGRGALERVFVGSVGLALLHGSTCPVAVAPRGYRERSGPIQQITVGDDGSHEAHLALRGAFEFASTIAAPVSIVAVAKPPPIGYGKGAGAGQGWHELKSAIEEQMRERLDEARSAAPDGLAVKATMIAGDPATALADAADVDGGVLVLGSRGYGPVKRVLLGSVAAEVVRSVRTPVLVFPCGVESGRVDEATAAVGVAT